MVISFFGNNLIPSSKEALLHLDACRNRNYTSPGDLVFELQEPWSTRSLLGVHEHQGATTRTHVDVLLGVITTTVSTTDRMYFGRSVIWTLTPPYLLIGSTLSPVGCFITSTIASKSTLRSWGGERVQRSMNCMYCIYIPLLHGANNE